MSDLSKGFVQLLIEEGLVTKSQIKEALKVQKEQGGRLGEILVQLGHLSEADRTHVLGKQFGMEVIDLDTYPIDPMTVDLLPRKHSTTCGLSSTVRSCRCWHHRKRCVGRSTGSTRRPSRRWITC